jgi:branched-chain amino acid transport system substrate-binding protein
MDADGGASGANHADRPQAAPGAEIVVRTFLIADVRGYTSFTHARGDEAAGELAARFAALAREAVTSTGGEVIELRGDEALCAFPSARQALRAAVELQIRFRERVGGQPVFPLGIGIGLAAGEAVPLEGGYRGAPLNLAARLCGLAAAGQILASETVTSLSGTVEGVRFVERRPTRVKGLERPVRAIEIVPEVELPPLPEAPPPRRSVRRRRRLWSAAGVLVLISGITAAAVDLTRGGGAPSGLPAVVPDSVAVVDPKSNEITGEVSIPGGPSLVAAGGRFVWVASDASRTISAISMDKQAVTHVVAPNATPSALAVDGEAVWILDGNRRLLVRIDPTYGAVTRRIKLPLAQPLPTTNRRLSSLSVASGAGAVWVTDGSTRLLRIDPGSARGSKTLDVHDPLDDVAVGAGAIWATSGQASSVFQIDPQADVVKTRIRIVNRLGSAAPFPVAVTVGEGSVWVLNGNTQTVSRIDPAFGGVTATIPLGIGRNPSDIAAGAGAVWVANAGNGTLARIDPNTNAAATIGLGGSPAGVAIGGDRVWVTVQPGFRAGLVVPRGAGAALAGSQPETLPASICSPVEFQGKGQPRYLIASDLPFQGQANLAETLQMTDAIRFVLAQHHFRAGPYSVGYQSCDDSIAATGNYDVGRCKSNAQAYAASSNVIGVIGTYNSGCTQAEIAPLEEARAGPIAMISSTSTYVGLTHAGAGTAPAEPGKYYPHGVHNFARVVAADDRQGAADALLANRLGVKSLYLLHDPTLYGKGLASNVRHAATKLGILVVGVKGWDPHAHTYTAIARGIKRAGADGVFLGGSVDLNGATLVKSLRAVLGKDFRIFTPDGFTPIEPFAQLAGPAAEGVMVSFPAVPPERLRGEGRRFVAAFEKAIGRPAEAYSVATAQAAEVLVDAIARSDGSRGSVTANVFKTRVTNGILGNFSFDRNGDTTAGAITIYQIAGGKPTVFRVITPPASLLR